MNFAYLLFGFHGRINRSQYWLGNVLAGVGGIALVYAMGYGFGALKATLALSWLSLPFILIAMTWSGFALQVKRFHDRGRSGFLVLAPLAPMSMIVGAILVGITEHVKPAQMLPELTLWFGILGLINLWFLIELGMLGSAEGPNKYGDPPGAPRIPRPQHPDEPSTALRGAEEALARAIAQQAQTPTARATPAPLAAPQAPASFGRRAAR